MNTNILTQFNDVELVEELKKRGFLCSASAWYKAECETLKERIRVLESQNKELKERVKDLENYLEID